MSTENVDRLLLGQLSIALLCLKITGTVDMSWWWIVAPLIWPIIPVVIIGFIAAVTKKKK